MYKANTVYISRVSELYFITVHVSERIIHESPITFYAEFYIHSLKICSYVHSFLVMQKTVLYMLRIKLV